MQADLFANVGVFSRGLDTLARILDKGEALAAEKGAAEADWLGWRLADDMFPLRDQAITVIDFARGWPARAIGGAPPARLANDAGLAQLREGIAAAKAELAALKPEQFAGRDAVPLTNNIGQDMTLPTAQWVIGFALPNFFFHLSMAYAILRQRGAPLGKRDFFAGGL